jgi:hypothetical protein
MHTRILSVYLGSIALWQAALYSGCCFGPDSIPYLDPRLGYYFLGLGIGLGANPDVLHWMSAVVLLALAVGLFVSDKWVAFYAALEPLMAFPTLIFFFHVMRANLSPSHGFSVAELTMPAIVFMVCTAVPWTWAVFLLSSKRSAANASSAES